MKFTYLTLFPAIIESFFQNSIMRRAVEKGWMEYSTVQLRDFAYDSYHSCDAAPYGGGAGMLLKSEPLARALESVAVWQKLCIYPSPSGYPFRQKTALALSRLGQLGNSEFLAALRNSIKNLRDFPCPNTIPKFTGGAKISAEIIFICGRYEGIDQRIIDQYVDLELSIGDYVLSSGELSSLCLTDAIYRLCDNIISRESLAAESFSGHLLEYPQYTRPEYFCGQRVPEPLLSGHHEKIRRWQLEQSVRHTLARRPELIWRAQQNGELNAEILALLREIEEET